MKKRIGGRKEGDGHPRDDLKRTKWGRKGSQKRKIKISPTTKEGNCRIGGGGEGKGGPMGIEKEMAPILGNQIDLQTGEGPDEKSQKARNVNITPIEKGGAGKEPWN